MCVCVCVCVCVSCVVSKCPVFAGEMAGLRLQIYSQRRKLSYVGTKKKQSERSIVFSGPVGQDHATIHCVLDNNIDCVSVINTHSETASLWSCLSHTTESSPCVKKHKRQDISLSFICFIYFGSNLHNKMLWRWGRWDNKKKGGDDGARTKEKTRTLR